MTRTELTDLLHRHVEASDPGEPMAVADVVRRGQRRVRRRRAFGGITCVAIIAAAVVLAPTARDLLPRGDRAGSGIDPATQRALADYDASAMPRLIDEHVRSAFAGSMVLPDKPHSVRFFAVDSQGRTLPKRNWTKASGMTTEYDAGSRRVVVDLTHSKSGAEGNARQICASSLQSGYELTCSVSRTDAGVATTTVDANVPLTGAAAGNVAGWSWAAVTRSELAHGTVPRSIKDDPGVHGKHLDTSRLWFARTVEVVHSKTFVTSTTEYVHAPTYADALRMFKAPVGALMSISTDPALVIPNPSTTVPTCSGCHTLSHEGRRLP